MQLTTELTRDLRIEFIRDLRAVKFTEEQAETLVNIIERRAMLQENVILQNNKETAENKAEILSIKSKELATKGDIKEVELVLRKEIKEIESSLRKDIKDIELKIKEVEVNLELKIKTLEVKLEQYRYDTFKFIVWTGVGVVVSLGGLMAKGFHWW